MADLHLFGGEKGGVGKSFVARAATQLHIDRSLPFAAFDTDRSNPDLMRLYSPEIACKVGIFSEGERYEDTANQIYNTALKRRVLVNLPAQVFIPLKEWVEKNELLEIAAEDGITFFLWFVSDGGYDSLKLFRRSLKTFGRGIQHIFVKNWGRCEDWSGLEEAEDWSDLLSSYKVPVIDFPKFIGNSTRNQIDEQSLSFGKAAGYKPFGSIGRQRVKKFLREAYAAFDESGAFET